ncbi:MAG: hypothetical protein R3B95_21695, partial [Nitrospirales bacterium]|nr:hypothetical protein [Nitrospirales bacterium]
YDGKETIKALEIADFLTHVTYRCQYQYSPGVNEDLDMAIENIRPIVQQKIVLYDEEAMRAEIAKLPEAVRQAWV